MAIQDDQTLRNRIDALLEPKGKDDDQETGDSPDAETIETDTDGDHINQDDAADSSDSEDSQIGLSDSEIEGGDSQEDTPESEPDQDDSQDQGEPITAKSLAEKLGVDVKEVYEMKFPYGRDGESLTLGELKDVGIRARDLDSQTTTLEQDREAHTNDKMVSRAEMQNIISLLPEIPQALVDQAKAQYRNVVNQERISLMETMPSWTDPAKERADRDLILENLKTYGFTEIEMDHMMDHRLVKLLNDFTRLKAKIVKPRSDVKIMAGKRGGKKSQSIGARQRQANRKRANELGAAGDTRGAIDKLLGV